MTYFKLDGLNNDIQPILSFLELKENEFCLLSFTDKKSVHYLAINAPHIETIKLLFPEKNIQFVEITEYDMNQLMPLYEHNKKEMGHYSFIGDPNLMPFGINFTR